MQYQYNVPSTGLSFANTVTLPVTSATPAIFSLAENGSGPGAILNQDYSVNSASNPAAAETEIQIFGTGGGGGYGRRGGWRAGAASGGVAGHAAHGDHRGSERASRLRRVGARGW